MARGWKVAQDQTISQYGYITMVILKCQQTYFTIYYVSNMAQEEQQEKATKVGGENKE